MLAVESRHNAHGRVAEETSGLLDVHFVPLAESQLTRDDEF